MEMEKRKEKGTAWLRRHEVRCSTTTASRMASSLGQSSSFPRYTICLAIERALRVAAERVDMELERALRRVVRDTSSLHMPGLLHSPPMRRSKVTLFRYE